jgi:glycosyltransferase involved in cell wall biosynthesis
MRILNIIENLDHGAVENWLVRIFRESRKCRPEWEWTFYCILGKEGRLDRDVVSNGGKIIYSPVPLSRKLSFLSHLRLTLKKGNFDVIHSHHDYLSGFYLLASVGIRFKKRILHIHNTDKALPVGNKILHDLLLSPFKSMAIFLSDRIVGISRDTLNEFVGSSHSARKKETLLYYGVDFRPFEEVVDAHLFKKQHEIPAHARILLYVGRFTPLKNPLFVVEILYELIKKDENYFAVFVGTGALEKQILERSIELGITSNVRILGWSDDIALIMKSSDAFVFPRVEYPKEGLGLVVIEAQAAGLPMFITKGIVEDAIIVNELVHIHGLKESANDWASDISYTIEGHTAIPRTNCLALMKNSPFDLSIATRNFIKLYESEKN